MSDNTILGGPPSETAPTPDESTDGTDSHGKLDEPTVDDIPGDVASAIHRNRLYSLIAFGLERPDEDVTTALEAGTFTDELVESATGLDDDIAGAATAVADTLDDVGAATLSSQWASLFGVEEGVSVSPYEMTYLPGPLMTNVRRLADIRGFYEAFDLSIADGKNDRGDHICFLTEFLGHLCLCEAHLRQEGDDDGVAIVVDARQSFIEDHLGRWYWRFADEVSQHDDGFYAALADLLAALVEWEIETLNLEPEWVPDAPEVTEWNEDIFGDSGRSCGGCGVDTDGVGSQAQELGLGQEVSTAGDPTNSDRSGSPSDN